ncbi:uncharacterized protein LOC125656171 isoform X2 [Ostrea edulis]|uniref:uncharacterized protein LOC125656171 isoform X2 n=1 Tax=Ostrea edulis TaxID=37623 RepID=UPI0024AF0EDA|nr:uncharacterized protein LOC125656171 isoform X2 [Ostrea edulis]
MEQFHFNSLPAGKLSQSRFNGSETSITESFTPVKRNDAAHCVWFSSWGYHCSTIRRLLPKCQLSESMSNVSRIMKTCREKNYSNSCNVYTNPEDDRIFFCMKTKGVSQCINILCNSTFKRKTDMNALERIDTDILSPSCMYKYATMEFKDCVTNSSDAEMRETTERRNHTNLSGRGWLMLLAAFLTGVMISSIFFYLRDWIRKRWNARHSLTSISVQTEDSYATNEGYLNAVYTDISNLQEEGSSNDDASTNSNILDPGMYSGIDTDIPDVYNYSRPEEELQSDTYNFLKGSEERMLKMGRVENVQNEKTLNDTLLTLGEQSPLTENKNEDMQQLYFCLEKREDVTLFKETSC